MPFTRIEVKVDDGKPPGTPYRWRRIGWVHEACKEKHKLVLKDAK